MPTVKLEKSTKHAPNDAFQKISGLLENDSELRKLDPKYTCDFDQKSLSGTATGSQFKANMNISPDGDGSKVSIAVELPFHLGLIKGMVSKTLDKKLDEALS